MRAAPYWPGKDADLIREVDAGAIHEIDDRDPLAHRNLLRAQDLGDRLGPPRAGLDGRVVRDDHHLAPLGDTDPGDDARAGCLAVVAVVRHQEAKLEPWAPWIEQAPHPLARRQLSLRVHLLHAFGATPLLEGRRETAILVGECAQAAGAGSGRAGGHDRGLTSQGSWRPSSGCRRSGRMSASPVRTAARSPCPGAPPCPRAG